MKCPKPLAIDLFCGLGGWADGLLAEGWEVIGFDIEQHVYGDHRYPAQLVVQDVRTVHGSQLKSAGLIVASPPCQEYSYMAMPWTRAKAKAAAIRADTTGAEIGRLNELFNTCFRIRQEACEAAGLYIPMVVENVRGAQPWVGRARFNYGSFYLWGNVPALMPPTVARNKMNGRAMISERSAMNDGSWFAISHGKKVPGFRFDGSGRSFQSASVEGRKGIPHRTAVHWTNPAEHEGVKQGGDWFAEARKGGSGGTSASYGSKSPQRKFASAMIAKIPEPLSRHIGRTFHPHT